MNLIERLFSIAKTHFFIENFEVRNRDSLDFHSCHVASIKDALEESYELGVFDTVIKNFALVAHANFDDTWSLFYINKNDEKVFLKEYCSLQHLKNHAIKHPFDFGFTEKVKQ